MLPAQLVLQTRCICLAVERQQIAKLRSFPAFQTRLALAYNVDHTGANKSQSNRVRRLLVRTVKSLAVALKRR